MEHNNDALPDVSPALIQHERLLLPRKNYQLLLCLLSRPTGYTTKLNPPKPGSVNLIHRSESDHVRCKGGKQGLIDHPGALHAAVDQGWI
jgi:hypothetical protein